jgi:hypothetical protein
MTGMVLLAGMLLLGCVLPAPAQPDEVKVLASVPPEHRLEGFPVFAPDGQSIGFGVRTLNKLVWVTLKL